MAEPLCKRYPKHFGIPIALILSTITLCLGLFLPVITLKELLFWKHTFSILTGIQSLYQEGYMILALIIVLFSVWLLELSEEKRKKSVHWLGILGKWSMLDVFVVEVMIVVAKISKFASAEAHAGIYFFGTSIILAILSTMEMDRLLKKLPV